MAHISLGGGAARMALAHLFLSPLSSASLISAVRRGGASASAAALGIILACTIHHGQ